jgi:diguanylate cyclase (GGDEF)-like protein
MMRMLVLLSLLLLTAFTGSAFALDPVSLQLKWKHQFQFAGYYAALEKGYYREAGLDVSLIQATPETDVVAEVVSGRAQFGVGTSELVLSRQTHPVVALGVIMQHSPQVLLARAEDISSVHELAGQKIMLEPHAAELLAYLQHEGIPEAKLQIIPHSFSTAELIAGKIVAMSAYSTTEPYALKQANLPYMTLNPRAAGIDFYGDNLFTVEQELGKNPDRTRAFLAASLRGWQYAMERPEEIIQLIMDKYNTQELTRDFLRFEAAEMAKLMQPELIQVGYMNPGRWQHIADTYSSIGMLPQDAALDGLIFQDRAQPLPKWVWPATIIASILVSLFGILSALSISFSRRLKIEIAEHLNALQQLETSNSLLQQQLQENTNLQQRLKEQTIRDPLSGLHNRRYLDETLPRELARAGREGYPLSIIIIDLDRFKQINDTYGHAAGDCVIKALAEILTHATRAGDITCRYGGEEFVVVLPRTTLEAACDRAEEWRLALADRRIRHGELTLHVTFSAGIAVFPEHGYDMDALVHSADQGLYLAKHHGRDRVMWLPAGAAYGAEAGTLE